MKLVKKILNGETQYFTELVERYEKKVYRTCYRFVQNNEDALDLSQEVFIKVYNNLTSFKNSSSLSTWIYKVCVNTCLNFLRRKDRLLLDFNSFENSMNYNSYESSTNNGSSKSYNPETHVELKEIRVQI